MGMIGLGTVMGAYFYPRVANFSNPPIFYWVFYGLLTAIVFTVSNIFFMFAVFFLLGVSGAFVDISLVGSIQSHADSNYLGKVFSYFSTLANLGEALSNLIVGYVLIYISAQITGSILGAVCTLCAGLFILIYIRENKTKTSPAK